MDKVAVFIRKYSIGKSSPVVCMLDLLSDNYKVDLFIQDAWCTKTKVLKKGNINLINMGSQEWKNILTKTKQVSASLFNKTYRSVLKHNFKDNYRCYICFDPHGFLLCKELFPEARPFYYSLELYFRDDHYNLEYSERLMDKERMEINTIKGLIIQSRERELLFRENYNLSSELPVLLLPVTYLHPSVRKKSLMLKKKYNISSDKKIALHLGGIQEYYSCIELALAFSKLDNWVLILHGYHFGSYIKELKKTIKKNSIKNVFISEEVYEDIDDMDPILMSCDVGIAWYNNISPNFSTAGKSSGKISAYLRFGLPVITNRYNSTVEAIEQTGCGICVDDFSEIKDALLKIEGNYNYYSSNCLAEYDRVYWFENYKTDIINFLRHNSDSQHK